MNEIQNGGRRHLEFIIFVHFGQMVYFRWQPSRSLQNTRSDFHFISFLSFRIGPYAY